MKRLSLTITLLAVIFATRVAAQQSPPAETKATVDGIEVTIAYSQPALKNRPFGTSEFHPFGSVWRNGANAATTLDISDDITINGEALAKGKYSFYVIPDEEEWTLIFNSNWDQWGTQYNSSTDVLRVKAESVGSDDPIERYTIKLGDNGEGSLNWGNFKVVFTVAKS